MNRLDPLREALRGLDRDGALDERALESVVIAAVVADERQQRLFWKLRGDR